MTKLTAPCCTCCTHTPNSPCKDYVECLTTGPLCHESDTCSALRTALVETFTTNSFDTPLVYVGAGTCGLSAGANKVLAAIDVYCNNKQIDLPIVSTGCIGLCSAEPIVDVRLPGKARVSFSNVTAETVGPLLDVILTGTIPGNDTLGQFREESAEQWDDIPYLDEHPFFVPQTRWVLKNCGIIDPVNIDEYFTHGGYRSLATALRTMTPDDVCSTIETSGLRGRGGGGFPTGKKWKFALNTPSDQKYVICNADEGDPGAFMDRAVIEGDPHRLLEGLSIAAYGIGASKAYVYIRAEYPLAIERLEVAIAQAKELGLLGYNILDSGNNLEIIIKKGAGAFVCGEETALIHSIEGKRGMPRPRPPFPAVCGLFQHPTIINNVETLSNIPGIMGQGPEAFASLGTETSNGTKVFALSGKVARTGLVEIEMGKPVRDIVQDIGGGVPNGKALKAVQIGGPSGGCIPADHMDIKVDYESLREFGAMMGSGGLVVMDEDNCMVDVATFFMEFIQRESCGKCIPCREGTRRMLEILKSISRPRGMEPGNEALSRFKGIMQLEELSEVIKDTSLCGLGQTAPNPVLTTLKWYREEYEAHIFERKCPAGACVELLTYEIDEEKCTGCTICARKCPTDAIRGARKSPHYVVNEKCIACGTCIDVCKFDAVTCK